jgi:signal-transduction protein with cAMP-binding, CBS, and nucleotidyltransferase domain
LFPIFTGARVLSIRHQIPARSTSERLQATARKGVMTEDTAEAVLAAHETILKAILGQQLRDMSAGVPLSNLVETGRLGTREKRLLRQAVREIELIVDMVAEARF